MKFTYGQRVVVTAVGFYKGCLGHVTGYRSIYDTHDTKTMIYFYTVLLDYPPTANIASFSKSEGQVIQEFSDDGIKAAP